MSTSCSLFHREMGTQYTQRPQVSFYDFCPSTPRGGTVEVINPSARCAAYSPRALSRGTGSPKLAHCPCEGEAGAAPQGPALLETRPGFPEADSRLSQELHYGHRTLVYTHT